ncbi:hypothetical protein GUJ93_ZPchr0007g3886 [Zizania palustris]|uniref:Uncharacterized protein n=1 Tax=Zizania palustris TaxID=103762 RepID=A0A8J5TAG9_ZIZPA|nr:hypothetical protein GUJ93_ZPchr0007g3886 [Zizania palustris]
MVGPGNPIVKCHSLKARASAPGGLQRSMESVPQHITYAVARTPTVGRMTQVDGGHHIARYGLGRFDVGRIRAGGRRPGDDEHRQRLAQAPEHGMRS